MAVIALAYNFSTILEIIRRVQGKVMKAQKLAPSHHRTPAPLNPDGETVSVELALNSRCTSDYNGRQKIFHWGLFDPQKRMKPDDVQRLIDRVQIPRFTNGSLNIRAEKHILYFLMENEKDDVKRAWMMIESGMQQQVVCLLCAAFGIGMVFKGLGDNGTKISDFVHANIRMKVDAMRPSYSGSYWCESAPNGWRPWLNGNLPSPTRNGNMSLTRLVSSIDQDGPVKNKPITFAEIGQLLWAARGRTPHYYKSKPWGMTIPVSRGDQKITNVLLLHTTRLFRYSNWKQGRPTHRLDEMHGLENTIALQTGDANLNHNCHIILSRNEKSGRALWEIGYQLINILLQAKALEIETFPALIDDKKRYRLKDMGISDAWCIVSMYCQEKAAAKSTRS
jgi:hypothetical protein